jgi:hypothetical protein
VSNPRWPNNTVAGPSIPPARASTLPSRYYVDPDLHAREMERIFGVYHFQGLVREFLGEEA